MPSRRAGPGFRPASASAAPRLSASPMVPVAVTLSDLVEKGGAYAGLAAFFGLAVLAVLHFPTAREPNRLRGWAGRAPERAQELEERVMTQAEQALRVRAEPQP